MITQTGGERILFFFFCIVGVYVEFSVTVNEVTIYVLTDTYVNQCVGTHTDKHTQNLTQWIDCKCSHIKNNQTYSKTHR